MKQPNTDERPNREKIRLFFICSCCCWPWCFTLLLWLLGTFQPRFIGFQQHDSSELLNFILDGLHEDVNRILTKPIVAAVENDGRKDVDVALESWAKHKQRNDSIIVDLCQGLLKSTVICPVASCSRRSVTFDPFLFLTVPLFKSKPSAQSSPFNNQSSSYNNNQSSSGGGGRGEAASSTSSSSSSSSSSSTSSSIRQSITSVFISAPPPSASDPPPFAVHTLVVEVLLYKSGRFPNFAPTLYAIRISKHGKLAELKETICKLLNNVSSDPDRPKLTPQLLLCGLVSKSCLQQGTYTKHQHNHAIVVLLFCESARSTTYTVALFCF